MTLMSLLDLSGIVKVGTGWADFVVVVVVMIAAGRVGEVSVDILKVDSMKETESEWVRLFIDTARFRTQCFNVPSRRTHLPFLESHVSSGGGRFLACYALLSFAPQFQ